MSDDLKADIEAKLAEIRSMTPEQLREFEATLGKCNHFLASLRAETLRPEPRRPYLELD